MPAATVSTLEAERDVLERIEQVEALKAQLHVEAARLRAELSEIAEGSRQGFAEMELAGTALVGQIRASRELDDSRRLVELFPRTAELAGEGLVFVPAVEAVLQATRRCTEQVQQVVDARIAGQLPGCNVTDVRRLVARTVLAVEAEIDAALTQERLDAVRQDARVWVSPGDDGMTSIGAVIDAVAGRRWALDFEQLVRGQRLLDERAGVERPVEAVKAEVFAHLPSLVLELVRAARDGRLTELMTLRDLDQQAIDELVTLAASTRDVPLPAPDAEIRVEDDPFEVADLVDPWTDLRWEPGEPPAEDPPEPGPPPSAAAAQDAAFWRSASPTAPPGKDLHLEVLVLRCLQMPLQTPTTVNLHIPMATVLDLTDAPGVLEGHGPLGARRIRELVPAAALREVYVDARSGVPLGAQPLPERPRPGQAELADLARRLRNVVLSDAVEPQHDPSAALARFVKLRDQWCTGPGCTMSAAACHLDHEDEFPEGPTAEWNLSDKSPRCHGAKHHGWAVDRRPDGSSTWTSPTGRTYTSRPAWAPPPTFRRPAFEIYLPSQDEVWEIDLA